MAVNEVRLCKSCLRCLPGDASNCPYCNSTNLGVPTPGGGLGGSESLAQRATPLRIYAVWSLFVLIVSVALLKDSGVTFRGPSIRFTWGLLTKDDAELLLWLFATFLAADGLILLGTTFPAAMQRDLLEEAEKKCVPGVRSDIFTVLFGALELILSAVVAWNTRGILDADRSGRTAMELCVVGAASAFFVGRWLVARDCLAMGRLLGSTFIERRAANVRREWLICLANTWILIVLVWIGTYSRSPEAVAGTFVVVLLSFAVFSTIHTAVLSFDAARTLSRCVSKEKADGSK